MFIRNVFHVRILSGNLSGIIVMACNSTQPRNITAVYICIYFFKDFPFFSRSDVDTWKPPPDYVILKILKTPFLAKDKYFSLKTQTHKYKHRMLFLHILLKRVNLELLGKLGFCYSVNICETYKNHTPMLISNATMHISFLF